MRQAVLTIALAALAACRVAPAPEARIGAVDGVHPVGVVLSLDGSGSAGAQSFAWRVERRPAGSRAGIALDAVPITTFRPDVEGEYEIGLVVSNGTLTAEARAGFEVRCGVAAPGITIAPPPAGARQGRPLTLSATMQDADERPPCSLPQALTVRWSFGALPAGSAATLGGAGGLDAWFVPDREGRYELVATATDATGRSGHASVELSVGTCGGHAPVIESMEALPGAVGQPLGLSARVLDPDAEPGCGEDGELRWAWRFTGRPAGSHATLNDPTVESPSFLPDVAGAYEVELSVTDATGRTASRRQGVEVSGCGSNPPVVVELGALPRFVNAGQFVSLTAEVSDADNAEPCVLEQPHGLEWSLLAQPAGSRAALNEPGALTPWLHPDLPGEYVVAVQAIDSTGRRSPRRTLSIAVSLCGSASPAATVVLPAGAATGLPLQALAQVTDTDEAAPCGAVRDHRFRWRFVDKPAGSLAALDDARLATPSFVPDVPGRYVLELVVFDADGHASTPAYGEVEVAACGARAPILSTTATPSSAGVGQPVRLEAVATDPDDAAGCGARQGVSFVWTLDRLPAGSQARLDRPTASAPTFLPDVAGDYVFRVRATDTTGRSATVDLAVPVSACGAAAPLAAISSAADGRVGAAHALAAGITDADNEGPCLAGQSFTTRWSFDALPVGSRATVAAPDAVVTSFFPDVPGEYVLRLEVADSTGRRSRDAFQTVRVDTCGVAAPIVTAVPSTLTPAVGQLVALTADALDADNDAGCAAGQTLSHAWTFETLPAGSAATLTAADTRLAAFQADVPGEYRVRVVSTDSTGRRSAAATVTVTASACGGNAPTATVAAAPAAAAVGSVVALEPAVRDADNGAACRTDETLPFQTFSYAWTLLARPSGSLATLSAPGARTPSFVTDAAGEYALRLVVTDSTGRASEPVDAIVPVDACGANAPADVVASAAPADAVVDQLVTLGGSFTEPDDVASCTALSGVTQTHRVEWRVSSAPAGSAARVDGADRLAAGFHPDLPGAYELELSVTDSTSRTSRARTTVTAGSCGSQAPAVAPSIAAGALLQPGAAIQVLANATDADDAAGCAAGQTLTFRWSLLEQPPGSTTFLATRARDPSFLPDLAGTYVLAVQATDSTGRSSAEKTVSVTVGTCGGNAPVARARLVSPTTSEPGTGVVVDPVLSCLVQLDARGSSDADAACGLPQGPEQLRYFWEQTRAPLGSVSQLVSSDRANPWLSLDVGGTYEFRLWASDGERIGTAPATIRLVHAGFSIRAVQPAVACASSAPSSLVLTAGGQGFLRIRSTGAVPRVLFDGSPVTVTALSGCTDLGGGVDGCSSLELDLNATPGVGDHPILVQNPVQDGCVAAAVFSVGPAPSVTDVSPSKVCAVDDPLKPDAITLRLDGSNFLAATQALLSNGAEARNETLRSSTVLDATFDVPAPGSYGVTASNGAGCSDTLKDAVRVLATPLVFFVDPPVLYNGISTAATVYVSGLNGDDVSAVRIRPAGSADAFTTVPFTFDVARPNQVQVVVPANLDPGTYEVLVTDREACTSLPAASIRVTATLTLALASIDPRFGWKSEDTSVDVRATNPPPAGKVGFVGVPRAYLNPVGGGGAATALTSVSLVDGSLANAVIRRGLTPGLYDVIVVNPDGAVGLLPAGYQVTDAPPPLVDSITPGSIPNGGAATVKLRGLNFDAAATVDAECLSPDGTQRTTGLTVTSRSSTELVTSVPANDGNFPSGTICVLVVTNPDLSTGEFSALGVTSPSENLATPTAVASMLQARRAPVAASGRPTRSARFIYAIGGDGGSAATAHASVEAAPVDRFGNLGAWRALPVSLPAGRTMASGLTVGRYVYVVGGSSGGAALASTLRAEVLRPSDAPEITDLFLEFADSGLTEGSWFYRVSAVMNVTDEDNPAGETLASDPLAVVVPASLPRPLRTTLTWSPRTGAAQYRIYRTPRANDGAGQVELLATVSGSSTSFQDTLGSAATLTAEVPRRLGDLGAWRTLPSLVTARQGFGLGHGIDPVTPTASYLYAIGGLNGSGAAEATYELLAITTGADGDQTVAAAWQRNTGNTLRTARWQAAAFTVDDVVTTRVPSGSTWLHMGPGANAAGSQGVSHVDAARVEAGGSLSAWQSESSPNNRWGYSAVAAANQLFIYGGDRGAPAQGGVSAQLCGAGGKCSGPPGLENWNAGISLSTARALAPTVVESARIFFIGGQTASGATRSVESTIW